jgi:hypothetical protein
LGVAMVGLLAAARVGDLAAMWGDEKAEKKVSPRAVKTAATKVACWAAGSGAQTAGHWAALRVASRAALSGCLRAGTTVTQLAEMRGFLTVARKVATSVGERAAPWAV